MSVLSVDTEDEENLLDLSQCSEFDEDESVSNSFFDLLDNESLLDNTSLFDDKEDSVEYQQSTVSNNISTATSCGIQASRSKPWLPVTAPKRSILGPKVPPREPMSTRSVSIKPLKEPVVTQRTPITAPKEVDISALSPPRSPITAPSNVTMETRDSDAPMSVNVLPSSCSSRDKSTIIKLSSSTSFHYVPEELPFVELPTLAKKMKNQTSPRKRAFTVSCDDGPTLLLETKRVKTSNDPDLRTIITSNRSGKPRSVSVDSTLSPLLPTPRTVLPSPPSTPLLQSPSTQPTSLLQSPFTQRKITFNSAESVKSRLQLPNIHTRIELNTSNFQGNSSSVHNRVTQPLIQDVSHNVMTRKSIFASRPNIACYTSSGMGGFSLKHLGEKKAAFSLNHL